jgi:hypothetical protein
MEGCWMRRAFVAILMGCALASCGGGDAPDEPDHPAVDSVHELQELFADGDAGGVCALITRRAAIQAGEMGHGKPVSCRRDVVRAFTMIKEGGGWLNEDKPVVDDVETDGDLAWATLAARDDGWRARVPLRREAGRWKLDAFFGIREPEFARIEKAGPRRPFPQVVRPVKALTADGAPCPAITARDFPKVAGGCVLKAPTRTVPIEVLTPFGAFKFGDCSVTYKMHVDGSGKTWLADWEVDGSDTSGCSDISQCVVPGPSRVEPWVEQPWRGQIRGDGSGGFVHHVDLCLNTCVGQFAGDFSMRLAPDGDRWRVQPADTGATGFRIAAPLPVSGAAMTLSEVPADRRAQRQRSPTG